jgi:hypothetical protein
LKRNVARVSGLAHPRIRAGLTCLRGSDRHRDRSSVMVWGDVHHVIGLTQPLEESRKNVGIQGALRSTRILGEKGWDAQNTGGLAFLHPTTMLLLVQPPSLVTAVGFEDSIFAFDNHLARTLRVRNSSGLREGMGLGNEHPQPTVGAELLHGPSALNLLDEKPGRCHPIQIPTKQSLSVLSV